MSASKTDVSFTLKFGLNLLATLDQPKVYRFQLDKHNFLHYPLVIFYC